MECHRRTEGSGCYAKPDGLPVAAGIRYRVWIGLIIPHPPLLFEGAPQPPRDES
jgi:hypothetical protein